MKWGLVAIAILLFVALPVGGFLAARRAEGRGRGLFGLGARGLAGLVDGWIGARAGWAGRPPAQRRGMTAGAILAGFATVYLWPQID